MEESHKKHRPHIQVRKNTEEEDGDMRTKCPCQTGYVDTTNYLTRSMSERSSGGRGVA